LLNGRAETRGLGCDAGYTLTEMLVAMLGMIVVVAALVTLLTFALKETSRTFTRVDATEHARVEVETLMNELHSACTGYGVTPLQSGSTGSSMTFTTAYGDAAIPTAVQNTISWNSSTDALTDTTSSGTKTLLSNVYEYTNPSTGATTPMFQYFAYEQPTNSAGVGYTDADGNQLMMLLDGTQAPVPGTTNTYPSNNPEPLGAPLTSIGAASAVEVVMTLVVGATGTPPENTQLSGGGTKDEIVDSAVMRLTPAPNHVGSGSSFSPCE
jgi:Tfp pilus assembly protein PilV